MKTELEAVNDILLHNREEGITTLDPENDENVFVALSKLKSATKFYLSKNLVINTDINFVLVANNDGLIELPNFLKINFYSNWHKIAKRKDDGKFYVYNYQENTFEFEEGFEVECDIVYDMEFEDIPDYLIQEMIVLKASADYYRTENDNDNTLQGLLQELYMLERQLMIDISYDMDGNIFNNADYNKNKWGG